MKPPTNLSKHLVHNQDTRRVIATITPAGPRLTLEPVLDRILISSPDAGAEEQNMVDGIHLPATALGSFNAYAKVTVVAVAPGVKTVKVGDEVIVVKPQCQQFQYDGQSYYWTTEVAIMGICRMKVSEAGYRIDGTNA